ncbi:MAG: haloacid dehalogenase-like hydrolase [Ruminococcus sp.]|uniref:haloacid dehalogenase-like hydrolase n=1 Tax=Ruminococcus sp. TaxID=41978 RepID=UPI0025D890F1|nr:haloacid dehalogenase-like hydrolase [Ruminococcus sp.]MCR4794667.1 haloacid dehalogenase-like hydrolase [Ruminococcus sp.]
MNVFDFDNTLYHGESAVDLALYMIKTNKRIIKYLPSIFINLIKYKLCMVEKKKMVIAINDFLKNALRDKEELFSAVEGFWQKNSCKLDKNMLKKIKKDDVIITAGPDFLINGIHELLNTENIICSRIDADKMKVKYLNFGSNKVRRFKAVYGNTPIKRFYTDSFNDKALMDISDEVYIVKKGRLKRIK